MESKRIECSCHSFDHSMKITKDDGYIYLQARVNKYPEQLEFNNTGSYFIFKIKNYIACIWRAIFGLPNWYTIDCLLDKNNTQELINILQEFQSNESTK